MKLSAVTAGMVRQAIAIYQEHAYGPTARHRRASEVAALPDVDAVLACFHKEQVEAIPGYPCHRYSLRLGNRNYPFMKLLLQEHLVPGEFYFAVDTHDQMDVRPDYPDYEAFLSVRRFNRDLKQRIEAGFAAAGLDTAASLRRLLAARAEPTDAPSSGTVLIVDDEEDLADAVEALLKERGFRTVKLHSGAGVVRTAGELLPDLILLDYELPEVDGLQVIAQLRAEPSTQGIPVLLSSAGRVSMADVRKADGFLAKPFPAELLHQMVNHVLRSREVRP